MDRRRFIVTVPLVAAALTGTFTIPGCAPRRPLRVLMLGGTNFVGPHLVQTALDRGHEVTLFNRGETNPHMFPELEKLRGNRYPDQGEGLAALDTSRTWDTVIDTWQAEPGCVDLTARMLAERTERYVYISSIATYRSFRELGITEAGPMIDATEHIASFDAELGYRTRKRAGEQAVEQIFGDRGTVLRCTSIAGFNHGGDASQQAAPYWASRLTAGEPLLAPDDPTAVFQLIDVKDMASFAIRAIENKFGGAYNMVGPEQPLPLPDYLRAWSEATGNRSPIVWMEPQFLLDQGVRPFDDIPNWIPANDPEPGFYRISNARSLAHGLTYRPLADTIRDGIASLGDLAGVETPGLTRARELELIEAWHRASGSS